MSRWFPSALLALAFVSLAVVAEAQTPATSALQNLAVERALARAEAGPGSQLKLDAVVFAGPANTQAIGVNQPAQRPPSSLSRQRSAWRRVAGAAVGALGGFFAGAYLGAAIEGDSCNCDDPGLKGAVIGGPTGAVAGGIVGGLYLF